MVCEGLLRAPGVPICGVPGSVRSLESFGAVMAWSAILLVVIEPSTTVSEIAELAAFSVLPSFRLWRFVNYLLPHLKICRMRPLPSRIW